MENLVVYREHNFTNDPAGEEKIKTGPTVRLFMALMSDVLKINTCEFVVESEDTSLIDFSLDEPLTVYRDGKKFGIFYVQNVKRIGPRLYQFYANSAVGLLDRTDHYGGLYTGQKLEELVKDICGDVPFYIKSNLKQTALYGWLPIASRRSNLSQVLFAAGASLKTDLDGYLRIEPLWDGIASECGSQRVYMGGTVDYGSAVTSVSVTEHQYVKGEDTKQLFEGTALQGDVITFSEPMHSLSAAGFTIIESGANFARLSAGSGTLTGKTYIHNMRQVVKKVSDGAVPNVKTVKDATLISLVNSNAVAVRMADFYKWQQTIDTSAIYEEEHPGDRIYTFHPFDENNTTACLQSAEITFSNILKSKEKLLVGFIPPQPDNVEYYNTSELITEDGTWTVPDGVTSIRVVLIGGGWGGYSGLSGSASPEGPSSNGNGGGGSTGITYYDVGILVSPGGEGGKEGQGGEAGKVLSISLDVTPGQVFDAKIGVGGEGGAQSGSASNKGSEGTPSTFGDYSSANGGVIPGGWQEELSGKRYATDGTAGIAGGKGNGNTSSSDTNIVNGPTVNGYSPGANRNTDVRRAEYGSVQTSSGWTEATCSGGCGGGAAYGANGSPGSPASSGTVSASSAYAYAKGAPGGAGATAQPPPDQTIIGAGGIGGNGGGGGGGRGYARCQHRTSSGRGTLTPTQATAGPGGSGSRGGKGGPGGIWVYYSLRRPIQSGQFVTRDMKWMLGALKRRIIV